MCCEIRMNFTFLFGSNWNSWLHLRVLPRLWDAVSEPGANTGSSLCGTKNGLTVVANRRRSAAPLYKVGDKVWLSSTDNPLKGGSRKLLPRYIDPYPITRIINPVAARLELPSSLWVHPVFHVSKVKPVRDSLLQSIPTTPPALRYVDGGLVYTVKALLTSRRVVRGLQYLVDWESYGPADHQWVPDRYIVVCSLVTGFHQDHPDQPHRRPSGSQM